MQHQITHHNLSSAAFHEQPFKQFTPPPSSNEDFMFRSDLFQNAHGIPHSHWCNMESMKDIVVPKQRCKFRAGLDADNMSGWVGGRKGVVLPPVPGVTGWGQCEGSMVDCRAGGSQDCVTCHRRRGRFNGCLTSAWNITGQFVAPPGKIWTRSHHVCLVLLSVEIQQSFELWVYKGRNAVSSCALPLLSLYLL